jgi:hypothetical protein
MLFMKDAGGAEVDRVIATVLRGGRRGQGEGGKGDKSAARKTHWASSKIVGGTAGLPNTSQRGHPDSFGQLQRGSANPLDEAAR